MNKPSKNSIKCDLNIMRFLQAKLYFYNSLYLYREEADVDEFLISGDHDHYISSETIVLPNESVAYEAVIDEPKPKKRKYTHEHFNDLLTQKRD